MRTRAYYRGQSIGWEMAGRYLEGTRADRRKVRAYLDRTADVTNPFVEGVRDALFDRLEQRAQSIENGHAPRTISPQKARWLAYHC